MKAIHNSQLQKQKHPEGEKSRQTTNEVWAAHLFSGLSLRTPTSHFSTKNPFDLSFVFLQLSFWGLFYNCVCLRNETSPRIVLGWAWKNLKWQNLKEKG